MMLSDQILAFGQYFFSCLSEDDNDPLHDAERSRRLMDALSNHITHDDGEKIRSLFSNLEDSNLISTAIKKHSLSPIRTTIEQGKVEAFRALVEHLPIDCLCMKEPYTNKTLIMLTVERGHSKMTAWLLSKLFTKFVCRHTEDRHYRHDLKVLSQGSNYPFDDILNEQDSNGDTALMIATKERHTDCVRVLLCFSANALVTNYANKSALHLATEHHPDTQLVGMLTDRYAAQLTLL